MGRCGVSCTQGRYLRSFSPWASPQGFKAFAAMPRPRTPRTLRRRNLDVKDRDLEIEKGQAGLP